MENNNNSMGSLIMAIAMFILAYLCLSAAKDLSGARSIADLFK